MIKQVSLKHDHIYHLIKFSFDFAIYSHCKVSSDLRKQNKTKQPYQ